MTVVPSVVKSINIMYIYTLCTLFYKKAIEKTLYKIEKFIMSIEIIQCIHVS